MTIEEINSLNISDAGISIANISIDEAELDSLIDAVKKYGAKVEIYAPNKYRYWFEDFYRSKGQKFKGTYKYHKIIFLPDELTTSIWVIPTKGVDFNDYFGTYTIVEGPNS